MNIFISLLFLIFACQNITLSTSNKDSRKSEFDKIKTAKSRSGKGEPIKPGPGEGEPMEEGPGPSGEGHCMQYVDDGILPCINTLPQIEVFFIEKTFDLQAY